MSENLTTSQPDIQSPKKQANNIDRQQKYEPTWWPLLVVLGVIIIGFFIVSVIAAAKTEGHETSGIESICLANGSLMLALSVVFWICSFIMNPPVNTPSFTNNQVKYRKAKLINIFILTFRIAFAVVSVLCSTLFLAAGANPGEPECRGLAVAGTVLYTIFATGCGVIYFYIVWWKEQII